MYGTLISVDELSALIQQQSSDLVIADCRFSLANTQWGRKEYEIAHIPGAVYADINVDLSSPVQPGITGRHPLPDKAKFLEWVQNIGVSNNTQVIAYDQGGGGMAARLWWLMRWTGHDAVAVVDGGWTAWQRAGLSSDNKVSPAEHKIFAPAFRDHLIATADTVTEWSCDEQHAVVDSREARRYAGDEETIDPVAGHIPGAISRPFAENTNPDGTWRSVEALRSRFEPLLAKRTCDDIVFYCGSGVTACHNILAFKHAGLGDAKLYPGSWSEWIVDAKRAVAVGD